MDLDCLPSLSDLAGQGLDLLDVGDEFLVGLGTNHFQVAVELQNAQLEVADLVVEHGKETEAWFVNAVAVQHAMGCVVRHAHVRAEEATCENILKIGARVEQAVDLSAGGKHLGGMARVNLLDGAAGQAARQPHPGVAQKLGRGAVFSENGEIASVHCKFAAAQRVPKMAALGRLGHHLLDDRLDLGGQVVKFGGAGRRRRLGIHGLVEGGMSIFIPRCQRW